MLKHFFVIIILSSFGCILYGIWNIFLEVEDNACRMTYMFGQPQFSRVNLNESERFPNYGLYFYYEGKLHKNVNEINLNGAPVIFVPGNGGSYKQVRSLASVAIRKAMDNKNNVHLDYFTIDYNEELSGLYGGYLENQKQFLKISIKAILKMYKNFDKNTRRVLVVGHSMGGKVAQALLTDINTSNLINSIIFVSTPLDNPVVNLDSEINKFYETTNAFLNRHRISYKANTETNICESNAYQNSAINEFGTAITETTDVLLISIGGGNRDLLVRSGLTTSDFSDIHAMTSSIPNVWLSCDHLSSVWCLQLVLVINRFLFSISSVDANNFVYFNKDLTMRKEAALTYFVKSRTRPKAADVDLMKTTNHSCHENSRKVFRKHFKNGLRQPHHQMIHLENYEKFKKLYIEVNNLNENFWIYGCAAELIADKYVCERGTSLSHFIKNVPSRDQHRSIALLDLYNIKKTYSEWTHIVVVLPATNKQIHFNVDIHDPVERNVRLKAPRWFKFNKNYIINETVQGTIYYKIMIQELNEQFQAVKVMIEPRACSRNSYSVTTLLCIPWARGFERYNVLTENTIHKGLYINVPYSSPNGYNTSNNPISMEILLDPTCRYSISYQFSIANTMSRIVQEFYHWLPSHLTAVLFIVLKGQISKFHTDESYKCGKPYTGFFQFTSLYIITGCRILKKLLGLVKFLPVADLANNSFIVSVIVHSTAVAVSILASLIVWTVLTFNGYFVYKIALRLTQFSFATSSILTSVFSTVPITLGIFAISIALGGCSGLGLIFACVFYFLKLSNAYKDYLENWFKDAATNLLKNVMPKRNAEKDSQEKESSNTAITAKEEKENDGDNAETCDIGQQAANISNSQEGLQNFSYHVTLFLLLFVLVLLNAPATLAWVKNYRNKPDLPDVSIVPCVFTLGCLSLLWQLKAPNKLACHQFILIVLYISAATCILYCQEAVYRLNYLIAFVYGMLLAQELLGRLWKVFVTRR